MPRWMQCTVQVPDPRVGPGLSFLVWSVAMLASALACRGDRSRSRAATARDSTAPAVLLDTAAPAIHDRIGRSAPGAGESGTEPSLGVPGALDVLKSYFIAIDEHRFHDAYIMWSDNGTASGLSFEEFARGYDHTRSATFVIGRPGRMEGAAGSRYVDVPVTIDALTTEGKRQHFTGSIVLRRVVVPGADTAERRWHLYHAAISEVKR